MNGTSWVVLAETLTTPFDPSRAAEIPVLEAAGARLRLAGTSEEWAAVAPEVDAVLHWRVPVGEREITLLRRCRIIAHYGVGVDRVDVAAAARAGIYVTNVPTYGVDEVADHALTLLLACARKLPALQQVVHDGEWGVLSVRPIRRLRGRTLGVVGLGNVGSAVAARAGGFGLRVVACDPYVSDERFAAVAARRLDLDALLAASDLITLHVPLTEETRGMIGRTAFARMKPGTILVNTARGAVVDEAALLAALDAGMVAAAGLDVFAHEPLPANSPLRGNGRVVLTPHAAYFSEESIVDMQAGASLQVAETLAGRRPSAAAVLPGVDWGIADGRWRTDGRGTGPRERDGR
jgi:D-3-phosphoglycerate dehydrogenase